jgi:short-subunit dehydrogenase
MELELRGKKVLVTGASKGIGLACARAFAAEGARVPIASRSEADLKSAADAIARQHKTEVSIHPLDLRVRGCITVERNTGDSGGDVAVQARGAAVGSC